MASLPTGTVTFLFTDIEGSTRLLQQLGDRYADVLATYHRLLRTAIQEAQGASTISLGNYSLGGYLSHYPDAERDMAWLHEKLDERDGRIAELNKPVKLMPHSTDHPHKWTPNGHQQQVGHPQQLL